MSYEELLSKGTFSVAKSEKNKSFLKILRELSALHENNCQEYNNMMSAIGFKGENCQKIEDFPFLPVRLFKELNLKSIGEDEIFKIMTSSGTTGQKVSRIYLDRNTATNQQKTLVKIVSDFLGAARLPMIIIDSPSVIKNREMFSARGAGILGFSIFGSKKIYALDEEMNLQIDAIKEFLKQHQGKKILFFGFTFMVWQHFYKALKESGIRLDCQQGILLHGGGWKKLLQEAVTPEEFYQELNSVCNIDKIINYYGMVEQTGSIYMECEHRHLHASTYSDIFIRREKDFSVADIGEKGIIQVISPLARSYPGYSLLTEDEGIILGEDDCPCGRKGKYFKVLGRLKEAEIRGCSDTYAEKFAN